jgi:hypothetical protein
MMVADDEYASYGGQAETVESIESQSDGYLRRLMCYCTNIDPIFLNRVFLKSEF